jgi:hypothetical protein
MTDIPALTGHIKTALIAVKLNLKVGTWNH